MMRTLVAIALAAAAWRLIPTAAHAGGSAAEACLDAPTVACITEHFADGADLPLRAIPAARRDTPTTWLLRALRILGRADEAEQVAWREERGTHAPDRATDIAVARSVAAARAGGVLDPDLLDGLADLASPLAPLTRATGNRESVAWQAHWMAAYALLGGLATDAGVAEARDAPVAARTALRESPAWRGLMEGLARWNARVPPVHRPLGWRILATFRLDLDDPDGARDALDRSEAAPATGDEIELWWRLGDPARAEARARAAGEARVLGGHLERAARAALARDDRVSALAALDEAWTRGVVRDGRLPLDVRHLRRLVQLTVQAGDQASAAARAEAIRDLPASGTLVPQSHWVDAAAALNDIGAHDAAARMLRDLLAIRPGDLAASGLDGAAPSAPPEADRRRSAPRVPVAVELYRAGLRQAAKRLLRTTRLHIPPEARPTKREDVEALAGLGGLRITPEAAERIASAERLSERANWIVQRASDGAIAVAEALRWDAASADRVAGLLALTAAVPVETRVYFLLEAARGDVQHGRTEVAVTRLSEATTLLAKVDQPYGPLCRAMAESMRLGRGDIADRAFHLAVSAARAEPDAVRPAILLDAAACRVRPL